MTSEPTFAMVVGIVKAQLREAAATLRRMKMERWDYPSSRMAWWPDVVVRASDGYPTESTFVARTVPDPGAIDRMEEVLRWILWLTEDDDRKLVWARAERSTWRQLETRDGRCRATLSKVYDKALAVIIARMEEERRKKH